MLLCSISSRKVRHQFKVLGRFSFYPPCQQNSLKCALHGLHTAATTSKYSHVPVLANEIVREIMPAYRGNVVLDYTLGAGGHTRRLARAGVQRLASSDGDDSVINTALELVQSNIIQEHLHCKASAVMKLVKAPILDAVLFDSGMSSMQVDDGTRGFSFRYNGPLDMRMGCFDVFPAAVIVNFASRRHLRDVLRAFGEERYAQDIAHVIVKERRIRQLQTTKDLVEIVTRTLANKASTAINQQDPGLHPATRTMQALRTLVNDELCEIECALENALLRLRVGGRIAVICFQPLEDRVRSKIFARVRPHSTQAYAPTSVPNGYHNDTNSPNKNKGYRFMDVPHGRSICSDPIDPDGNSCQVTLHTAGLRRWRLRQDLLAAVVRSSNSGVFEELKNNTVKRINDARRHQIKAPVVSLPLDTELTVQLGNVSQQKHQSLSEDLLVWAGERCSSLEQAVFDGWNNHKQSSDIATALEQVQPPTWIYQNRPTYKALHRHVIRPTNHERSVNPRCRTATMQVYERID